MFYLLDAVLFLGFFALLLGFGLAASSPERPIAQALLVAPAGFLGVWATLFYLAGWVGLFKPVPFWIGALAVLLATLMRRRANLIFNARRLMASLRATSTLERVLLAYLGVVAALMFALCLVPPSAADYDSLAYHLAVPAQWLRDGRVSQFAFDHHSYFPFVGEMLYALALGVRDAVFAKLFHWAMLVFGALALCSLGRNAGGKTAGLWAAALFVSLPMTQGEATTAYVDLTFSAFAWTAIALFCHALWNDGEARLRKENWIGCGVFCGLSLGSKYFGWLILGFLGLWLLVACLRSRPDDNGARWIRLAWIGVPALVLGGFWYARNFAWTGNPVFPFAFSVFGGRGWTGAMAAAYDEDQRSFGFGKTLSDLILLPWRLAMTPLNAGSPFWPLDSASVAKPLSGLFDVPGLALSVFPGPVLFALGVPALLARRKGAVVGFLAWMFAFLWIFWALTSQQVRYLFPALGLLCVVCGWFLATRLPRFPLASRVAGVGLAAWLVFAPTFTTRQARGTFAVLSGAQTPDDYLRRTFAGYSAMQWIGDNTKDSSRVAVYGDTRDFYLPRSYFYADDAHNNLVPYDRIQTPAQLANALKLLGATHVLVNRDTANNAGTYGPPQPLFDQAVANGQLQRLYGTLNRRGEPSFEVYALK